MKTIRRILILGACVIAALSITTGGAMATKGVCQPDAVPGYQDQTLAKGNGAITVDVHYGWDGSSVWPVCIGPLISAHVTNVTQAPNGQTWYAVFPRPKRPKAAPIVITMAPGFDQTYTAAQLSSVGLDTNTDLEGLDLTQTPPS